MLHIIWSIIVGFIVGWIAKKTMGAGMGLKHMSFMWTVLLGVGGSILGGLIARLFSKPQPGAPFHPAGFIMSIIGAFVLLFIVAKLHLLG
jgi:uncharacterized membrane protein YeaQ/YmgE (transglycosylase-associated protein family)